MSPTLYVAAAAVVKVSLGAVGGNRVARFVLRGDVVPDGIDPEQLERLEARGLIEALPSIEDITAAAEAEAAATAAAEQAAFDAAVSEAAKELVLAREPELEAGIQKEVERLSAEREAEFDARVKAAAEELAAGQPAPKAGRATPASK
jgi:hypothetical protein